MAVAAAALQRRLRRRSVRYVLSVGVALCEVSAASDGEVRRRVVALAYASLLLQVGSKSRPTIKPSSMQHYAVCLHCPTPGAAWAELRHHNVGFAQAALTGFDAILCMRTTTWDTCHTTRACSCVATAFSHTHANTTASPTPRPRVAVAGVRKCARAGSINYSVHGSVCWPGCGARRSWCFLGTKKSTPGATLRR